jgi:hypothetical protein
VQDKTWIKGPENDWEFYTVLGDAPAMRCGTDEVSGSSASADDTVSTCC